MDLTGKQIQIERLSINNMLREATVLVSVYTVISDTVRKLDGSYEIKVEGEFLGASDPVLLSAVTTELETI
jgi:hypothetical protein